MKAYAVALGMAVSVLTGHALAQEKRAVAIYDSTEIALDRYTVIKRLGVQNRRSAFYIRSSRDVETATRALLDEAARLGADALVNLHCLAQSDRPDGAGYYCYGNAIKLKQ
jgi:uncharacterized protein YbjQ (UPF0145 family)